VGISFLDAHPYADVREIPSIMAASSTVTVSRSTIRPTSPLFSRSISTPTHASAEAIL
jgi:hypothetical protein